ncbi:hypothetical protein HAZT_HAZT005336 [Hyalella azteca]|uniref:Ras-GAP domain-containing protein n=1 Tax=Hyalella azteca TaxID=294128 RepID=A0A6A0H330_HYAAZ|nr:hypothetical protein HAZT_HAZT005336 [Hyalella azteca]
MTCVLQVIDQVNEWANMTGFLCALGGVCLMGKSPSSRPPHLGLHGAAGLGAPLLGCLSGSPASVAAASEAAAKKAILPAATSQDMQYCPVTQFVGHLLKLLVCNNERFGPQIQKHVKELVGHEMSPLLYPSLFDQIKLIVDKFFDQQTQVVQMEKDPTRQRLPPGKLSALRTAAIQAMSNLLSANIDSGLMHSIGLGYQKDLQTRAAFIELSVSADRFPPQLRSMCHCLFQVLSKRFPQFPQNNIGAVGTVIFLRFINPAIVTPVEMGILDRQPSPQVKRGLMLMSKILQNIANHVEFSKEQHMLPFNNYLWQVGREIVPLAGETPWLPNITRFCSHPDDKKRQKVSMILDKLITLTIEEEEMYPSIQAKIWGNIGQNFESARRFFIQIASDCESVEQASHSISFISDANVHALHRLLWNHQEKIGELEGYGA